MSKRPRNRFAWNKVRRADKIQRLLDALNDRFDEENTAGTEGWLELIPPEERVHLRTKDDPRAPVRAFLDLNKTEIRFTLSPGFRLIRSRGILTSPRFNLLPLEFVTGCAWRDFREPSRTPFKV